MSYISKRKPTSNTHNGVRTLTPEPHLDVDDALFDGVSPSFKTCRARFPKCRLLLLCRCLLLLLALLCSAGVLQAALPTRGNCTRRCASACITAHNFAHDCTTDSAARARTGGRPCSRGWRCGCRLLLCWLRRIEATLLDSPRIQAASSLFC